MTYVAAVRLPAFNALIADTLDSGGAPGRHAVKTGKLFAGAVYGCSGNAYGARTFIADLKDKLKARRLTRPIIISDRDVREGCWSLFEERTRKTYDGFRRDAAFEMLVLSRHSGESRLYRVGSSDRSINEVHLPAIGDFESIGRGKAALDSVLELQRGDIQRARGVFYKPFRNELVPYYYCHSLNEQSLGIAREHLENNSRVGGVFNFCYQWSSGEARQDPSVYGVCRRGEEVPLELHLHRVCWARGALIYQSPDTDMSHVLIDGNANPDIKLASPSTKAEWIEATREIVAEAETLPYYRYLGIVFADARLRGMFLHHVSAGPGDYLIKPEGIVEETLERLEAIMDGTHDWNEGRSNIVIA